MDIHRKALGEGHPLVAVTLNSLSRVLRDQGRNDEAAAALEAGADIARPALGSDHQLIAIYTLNLGAVQLARGQPGRPKPSSRRPADSRGCRRSSSRTAGASFLRTTGASARRESLLGAALVAQKRYSEAETVLLEARRDLEALSPPPRREVARPITRLVELYAAWGKPAEAARYRARPASSR